MSADADRKHGVCSQPCAMCHAEEIAQLTAECYQNARGRDDALAVAERQHKKNNALLDDVKAERVAHERTKAELEQAQHRLNDAAGALQDAGTPVVDERFDVAIQRLHAERDAARSERDSHLQRYTRTREHLDTAQAEAAAMRMVVETIHAGLNERNWIYEACERALRGEK